MSSNAIATVLGGFWAQFSGTLTQINGDGSGRRRVARELGKLSYMDLRARATALDGVAAGTTASKTYGRVVASSELGGLRATENLSLINRATTAADVTEIEADLHTFSTTTTFGASPPANLDGNPLGTR